MILITFAIVSSATLSINAYCSREKSRLVRNYLFRTTLPSMRVRPSDLLESCPFHASHDMYHDQENHKHAVDTQEYKCGYCGKLFVNELYIDRHMDRHHHNMIPSNATICLADYCPILGCTSHQHDKMNGLLADKHTEEVIGSNTRKSFGSLVRCDPDDIDRTLKTCEDVSWK